MTITALALDQSPTATGWAIGRPLEKPTFGTFALPAWKDKEGERMEAYEDWLAGTITSHGVTALYYESTFLPAHMDVEAYRRITFVEAVINLVAAKRRIDIAKVRIDDWRKWAFGYSRLVGLKGEAARKEWKRMALAACAKRDLWIEDDNAAEAVLILDFGLSDADLKHRRNSQIRHSRATLDHWNGAR